MSWDDLDFDERGVRPGHPLARRTPLATSVAASRLVSSTNTVRTMIAEGTLGGYWRRTPQRVAFTAYEEDLERYLRQYGPLNHRRRDRRASLSDSVSPGKPSDLPGPVLKQLNRLAASLADLSDRVSRLEERDASDRSATVDAERTDLDWERQRRLELEDALAALQADDELVEEADTLQQQAYAKLRSAHQGPLADLNLTLLHRRRSRRLGRPDAASRVECLACAPEPSPHPQD